MTQTLALLLDAYRELNARKMFWISLIISALIMVGFAFLGVSDKGLTIFGMDLEAPAPFFVYKSIFSYAVIGLWVSFAAMVLAIISTASIFPDLLASGSIDLYLAKPISRLRLFLMKFAGGLLFVLLQTTVFAVASYLVWGLRAKQWEPAMFLIIPLGTLLFSYLFVVSVLFGVLTRSAVAAILLTCVFWLLCFAANTTEQMMFGLKSMHTAQARVYERQVAENEARIAELKQNPSKLDIFGVRERRAREQLAQTKSRADQAKESARSVSRWYGIARGVATVIPKTGETVSLLDRKLFNKDDIDKMKEEMRDGRFVPPPPHETTPRRATTKPTTGPSEADIENEEHRREMEQFRAAQADAREEADRAARSRSVPWIIGTSVGFEFVVLALAAWIFCRRDY